VRGLGASRRRTRLNGRHRQRRLHRVGPGLALGLALGLACDGGGDGPPPAAATPDPAASTGQEISPDSLVDAAGRVHRFQRPPGRILSLVPSANAVLVELGATASLVGRTDFDSLPELAHLTSVGGGLRPDLERLLSLRPELVLHFQGPSDQATLASLERMGVPHFAVRPDGIEDVRHMIRQLGVLTSKGRAADSLLASIDHAIDEVRCRVSTSCAPPT